MYNVVTYLSVVEEWRLEEEEAFCNEGAVAVKRPAEVVETVSDSVATPVVQEVVASNGDSSVVCLELVVGATLGGWVNAPGRGLNKSVANCGLLILLGGVTAGCYSNNNACTIQLTCRILRDY